MFIMAFSVLGAVKFVAAATVGMGTKKIVEGVIGNNVPTPDNLRDKVIITAATWVISGIVTTAAKSYSDKIIDDTVAGVQMGVKMLKLQGKLDRINKKKSTFETEGLDENDFTYRDGKWYMKASTDAAEPVVA